MLLKSGYFQLLWLAAIFILRPTTDVSWAANDCDCSNLIGNCSAEVTLDKAKSLATVTASASTCARVIFDIDQTPYTTVFSGGKTIEAVTIFQKDKSIATGIRSCQVCRSNLPNGSTSSEAGGQFQNLGQYLQGSWQSGSISMRFDSNGSGAISNSCPANSPTPSMEGTVSCTGSLEQFSCTSVITNVCGSGKNYQGSIAAANISAQSFSLAGRTYIRR